MSNKKIIQENLSLTGILKWLEEIYKVKKTNKPFSLQDAEGYLNRGYIPKYMGGHFIEKVDNKYSKLYNVIRNDEVEYLNSEKLNGKNEI